ncbi:hypothetical protein L6164_012269 [Bauhinia variegata]|uniref:Uncharacterized protein n=1 Tax=Bauhinia variegata TaxID=167791 RepID=A0ACB9PAZ2_BAUVA|nr:hypothetical protein L6164_012269 [Bauhinia variegata]
MGSSSLEDEELVRMVQDFIESESASASPSSGPGCNCSSNFNVNSTNHPTADNYYLVLQEILRSGTGAESKVMEYVLKHMRKKGDKTSSSSTASLRKWLVMRLRMDDHLNASLCQTCWPTSLGCPAGEYEYVDVIMEEESGNLVRMIVDLDFKSQFEVARPTQSYRQLTNSLPVIFVGPENKLSKIISLLCRAAKQSLSEKGLHVPPWRTTTYMQSKWLSVSGSEKQREKSYKAKGGALHGPAAAAIDNAKWVPPTPTLKPKKRNLSGGSALSSQLSNTSINCC